jgi:hypothetical protein
MLVNSNLEMTVTKSFPSGRPRNVLVQALAHYSKLREGSLGRAVEESLIEFHFSPYHSPAGKSDRLMKQKRAMRLDENQTVKLDSQ